MFVERASVTAIAFTICLNVSHLHAALLEDANRLFNWAEIQYPTLFSPSKQGTQEGFGYLFRHYPGSNSYAGVHITDRTVHVLGPPFGAGIRTVGTLQALLDAIEKTPGSLAFGGCASVPLFVEGTQATIKSYAPNVEGSEANLTTVRTVEAVTNTYFQYSDELFFDNSGFTLQIDHQATIWYHLTADYWYLDEGNSTTTSTSNYTQLNIKDVYTETESSVWTEPVPLYQPKTMCKGDWWEDEGTCTTEWSDSDGSSEVFTADCSTPRQIVEAVNVPITVPAGTFQTVRVYTPGTNSKGEVDTGRSIVYYDIQTGTKVLEQLMDRQGNLNTINVLEAITY